MFSLSFDKIMNGHGRDLYIVQLMFQSLKIDSGTVGYAAKTCVGYEG